MACKHQFVKIEEITRQNPDYNSTAPIAARFNDQYGARVGCVMCGEIRTIWSSGAITIDVKGNEPKNQQKKGR